MNMKKKKHCFRINFYKFLLRTIGKILPLRRHPFGKLANSLRVHYARNISPHVSKKCIIESGAEIQEDVVISEGASIGPRCLVQIGTVFEGQNMMGPDVKIFTSNHNYSVEKHGFNGMTEVNPVYIGKNVCQRYYYSWGANWTEFNCRRRCCGNEVLSWGSINCRKSRCD